MKRFRFLFIAPFLICRGLLFSQAALERQRAVIPGITTPRVEKMVDVGGRKLHCCVYGHGSPAVVLLSGFNAPQEYWNPIVPALAETATVVTYDRAGYGKSEIGTQSCGGSSPLSPTIFLSTTYPE